ncbi:MAG: ATP-binding protein [Bacteroidales bacterium]
MMATKILIVEDDKASAKLLEIGMRRLGYEICGMAASGQEAVEVAASAQPDIVIMDINLPGEIDGIRAAEIIKQDIDVPVLFLSANIEDNTVKRALETDPIGYISKPYTMETLRIMVETGVYRHKAEARIREKEKFLSVLLANIGDGVIATDSHFQVNFINSAARKILGLNPEETIENIPLVELLHLYDEKTGLPIQWHHMNFEEHIMLKDAVLKNSSGHTWYVEYSFSRLSTGKKGEDQFLFTLQDITSRKEAEQALRNYNEKLEMQVTERTAELRQQNILLEKEIAQRKKFEQELEIALTKEKEINEFRTQIITTISHEFRTPLTTIQSSAELIVRFINSENEKEKIQKHLRQILNSAKNLNELLSDILTMEKLDRSSQAIQIETINTRDFFYDLIEQYRIGIGKSHIIEFQHNAIPLELKTDPKLLSQILNNLVSNACKYSSEGSLVLIVLYFENDHYKITVSDQGTGIPEKDLPKIFESFYRASNVGNISGTGLGLAILKRSVEELGGQITVDSKEGRGTIFTVTLPYLE